MPMSCIGRRRGSARSGSRRRSPRVRGRTAGTRPRAQRPGGRPRRRRRHRPRAVPTRCGRDPDGPGRDGRRGRAPRAGDDVEVRGRRSRARGRESGHPIRRGQPGDRPRRVPRARRRMARVLPHRAGHGNAPGGLPPPGSGRRSDADVGARARGHGDGRPCGRSRDQGRGHGRARTVGSVVGRRGGRDRGVREGGCGHGARLRPCRRTHRRGQQRRGRVGRTERAWRSTSCSRCRTEHGDAFVHHGPVAVPSALATCSTSSATSSCPARGPT